MKPVSEKIVKRQLRSALDARKDRVARFTPATGGYGTSGVSDDAGVVAPNGLAFYVECKKTDGETTVLQKRWLRGAAKKGAFCAVCWPDKFVLYDKNGEEENAVYGGPEDLVEVLLNNSSK